MTIRSCINPRALNESLSNFERCADEAPHGSYEQAKEIADLISTLAGELIDRLRLIGLKTDNCDRIREVEAVIYGYIVDSNPDLSVFPTAEGFGDSLGGAARERVLAQATRDMEALQSARLS